MSTEVIKRELSSTTAIAKFTNLIGAIRKVNADEAAKSYELEAFHFMREIDERGIVDVTPISALGAFLDVVSSGLSFGSGNKLVYLLTRNVKVTKDGKETWEKRLQWSTSPDGNIFLAQQSGAIDYVTKPTMVYEGDDFAPYTDEKGNQIIMHKPKFPRTSQKIVAGYVFVVLKGGKKEPYWMDMNDVERLKGYSARQNKDKANALYTSQNGQIDAGFFGAKLIKHALKNIRKRPINGAYYTEAEDTEYVDVAPAKDGDGPHYEEPSIQQGSPNIGEKPQNWPSTPATIISQPQTQNNGAASSQPVADSNPW
jgi:recombinational DNA repair protein RecT